jgi:nitroreductase
MEVINKRRSVREFLNTPIADDKIDLLVRAGLQAPTAVNQQANCFMVVRKRENLDKLVSSLSNVSMLKSAPLAIVVLIDIRKLKRDIMKSQDASSATTLILLEATSLGLGSCWCGIYPNEDRMNIVKEVLNISDDFIPFSVIALGYPKNADALRFIDRYDENKIFFD